jgi:hypothetical protein
MYTLDRNGVETINGIKRYPYYSLVPDDGTIALPAGVAGWGRAQIGDSQEKVTFSFTTAGVVTIESLSDNVIDTDTDLYFCVFNNGGTPTIKNRLGSSLKVACVVFTYAP